VQQRLVLNTYRRSVTSQICGLPPIPGKTRAVRVDGADRAAKPALIGGILFECVVSTADKSSSR
jgi:hypothetical protein